MKNKYLIPILLLLTSLLILSITLDSYSKIEIQVLSKDVENIEEIKETEKTEPIKITIGAVGDIMTHGPQLRAHYKTDEKTYDFQNNYRYVEPYIESLDLALCNIETVLAGEDEKYSSYPQFNTPDTLVDALLSCGFDVGVTSNNHSMDKGGDGLLRTLQVLEDKGLISLGTQGDETLNYEILQVNQVKIGLAGFTYETPMYQHCKTINGIMIPKEIEDNINTFNYYTLDEDLMKMDGIIEEMKAAEVQIIIFYLHWGQEYATKQNQYQEKIAKHLAHKGVDIIFGSHPHVLQPAEIITREDGHQTAVFYSLGNFISNQRYEILNNRHTEDGMIAQVEYLFYPDTHTSDLQKVTIIPTWVNRYVANHKRNYEILPIPDFLGSETLDHATKWRIENSLNNTSKIIGYEHFDEKNNALVLFNPNDSP